MSEMEKPTRINSDRPIASKREDALHRHSFAKSVAEQIAHSSPLESFVIGLLGPWGSGKTSILNLLEEQLNADGSFLVVKFNPWLFSGTDQLVSIFFQQLSAELKGRELVSLKDAADAFEEYGELLTPLAFVPVAGPFLGTFGIVNTALGKFFRAKQKKMASVSVSEERKRIEDLLRKSEKRILVIIDDIDRLDASEVADVMRLVRLVGDFPNMAYLLSFDRVRVEKALTDETQSGKQYLEKILQVTMQVPKLRQKELEKMLFDGLNQFLGQTNSGPFHPKEWGEIYREIIRPTLQTPRDVRRLLNAISLNFAVHKDEISLEDLFAMECIRTFHPELFNSLPKLIDLITDTREPYGYARGDERAKNQIEEILNATGAEPTHLKSIVTTLFPASQRYLKNTHYDHSSRQKWRRERRVAHPEVLAAYLEASLPDGVLAASAVQKAFEALGDPSALSELVSPLNGDQLEKLIERLEDYEHTFDPTAVESALTVILNNANKLRKGRDFNAFDIGTELKIGRLTLRMFNAIKEPEQRAVVAKQILSKISSHYWKLDLIDTLGFKDGAGHKLIPETDAKMFYSNHRNQVIEAPDSQLTEERDLVYLLNDVAAEGNDFKAKVQDRLKSDMLFIAYLTNSMSKAHTNEHTPEEQYFLDWDWLANQIGEDFLNNRTKDFVSKGDFGLLNPERARAMNLAQKYASGELSPPYRREIKKNFESKASEPES